MENIFLKLSVYPRSRTFFKRLKEQQSILAASNRDHFQFCAVLFSMIRDFEVQVVFSKAMHESALLAATRTFIDIK